MDINLAISVPEEVVEAATKLAVHSHNQAEDILHAWLRLGMVEALAGALLEAEQFEPEENALSAVESNELATLFARADADDFGEAELKRLNELLHRYRQYRMGETHALTHWLALGGAQQLRSPVIQLTTLRSNMLYAAGYDAERRVLDVVFKSGGVYRYYDVPPQIYAGLLKAPSVGRYMWDHVLRSYPTVRLDRKRKSRRVANETQAVKQAA